MEDAKESNQVTAVNNATEEIIKPHQEQTEKQIEEGSELQQEKPKQTIVEESEEEVKETESSGEKQQEQNQEKQQEPQPIVYEDDDDDDYDDDDEEKDTSQKLVIDIPDEEDEEKEDEDDDIIALDDIPDEVTSEKEKISPPKPLKVEAIITLSDGEDDTVNESVSKPGKVQKRRSVGASPAHEEEPIRLKRRKINAAGAPKLPLTGYVRYMHDRRDSMRKEHPSKTHMEHNKLIGEEWHSLPTDVKSSYLKAADVDKQRYVKELHSFLKSRPDVLASELAKNKARSKTVENNSPNMSTATTSTAAKTVFKDKSQTNDNTKTNTKDNSKDKVGKELVPTPSTSQPVAEKSNNEKIKRKRTPTPPTSITTTTTNATSSMTVSASTSLSSIVIPTPGEIPIFTNEFLEHNKIYDMELRSLRKSKTDLELQNSVLEKHVENMKFGVEKMMTENNELEEKNRLLEIYLEKLKRKLALALSSLPLPSAPSGATVDNIEKYMQDLYKMSTSNSTGPATLNKAKDIIRKLDLQIQL